jgi:D-3-phosphoglycerate dehydrogenase / 2-oxoglutarate reductase
MPTILVSAPYLVDSFDRFRQIFDHYKVDLLVPPKVQERMEEADLLPLAGQFDGAICGDDKYTADVLEHCVPRLKVISKWGTGIDSIDQVAARRLGVKVCNTPNAFTLPVADSVMGYMLAFARRQPWMDRAMKEGTWKKINGMSLSECTLGVVGVGTIGTAVFRRARGFGMRLLGNDIVPIKRDFLLENGVQMVSLKELLSQADFVSMNTDLNPTSYRLINAETLSWMKPSAVLINTSRGPVVDEKALIAALSGGQIAGAALDVFEDEPLPASSPLMKMDNVMLAPHNANSSPAAYEHVHWNTIRNCLEGLSIPCADLDTLIRGKD